MPLFSKSQTFGYAPLPSYQDVFPTTESKTPNHSLWRKAISWILLALLNAIIFGPSLSAKSDVFESYMMPVFTLDFIVVCIALAGFGGPSEQLFHFWTFVFKWANHFRPKPDKTKESDKASRKRPKGNERGRAAGEEEVYEEVGEQSEAIALGKMKGKGREGGQSGSICNNLDQDKHIDV